VKLEWVWWCVVRLFIDLGCLRAPSSMQVCKVPHALTEHLFGDSMNKGNKHERLADELSQMQSAQQRSTYVCFGAWFTCQRRSLGWKKGVKYPSLGRPLSY